MSDDKEQTKPLTPNMKRARQLRLAGYTLNQIGMLMGKTRQGVRYILLAADKRVQKRLQIGTRPLLEYFWDHNPEYDGD